MRLGQPHRASHPQEGAPIWGGNRILPLQEGSLEPARLRLEPASSNLFRSLLEFLGGPRKVRRVIG